MSEQNAPVNGCNNSRPERGPDWFWGACYNHSYDDKSLSASRQRAKNRKRKCSKAIDGAQKLVDPAIATAIQGRLVSKRHLVELRLTRGFVWRGGNFGGSDEYNHAAFEQPGLVSDSHAILKLFVSKLHRVRNLKIGDDKAVCYTSDSKLLACDAPYIYANSKVCGVLRVEIDATLPISAIVDCCQNNSIPAPNLVVGWVDASVSMRNPHLLWLLHNSVPLEGMQCRRFRGLYRGVLRGLTNAFLDIGADPGGLLNCHKHKNPLCPLWDGHIVSEAPYDLSAIAASVDCRVSVRDLHDRSEKMHGKRELSPDHPDAIVSIGSNALFRTLAMWAREQVVPFKNAGGSEAAFSELIALQSFKLVSSLTDAPEGQQAAAALAGRVSRWTWHQYRAPLLRTRRTVNTTELAARQAKSARTTSATRKQRSLDVLTAAAVALRTEGAPVTQVAVLARASGDGITSVRTVRRHWPAILAVLINLPTQDMHVADAAVVTPRPGVVLPRSIVPTDRPRPQLPSFMAQPR